MTEKFEDILEKCLERITVKGDSIEACLSDYPEHASRLEPLLRTAISTSVLTRNIQPTSELKLKAKNRMLNEAQGKQQGQVKEIRPFVWRYRWALPAVLLLLLLISSGVAIGANKSMPGEPLYSVKTTMEKVRLKLTPSDSDKAKLHIKYAERRAEEMAKMNKKNDTQEVEKLSRRLNQELNHTVVIAENIKSGKNGEKKVEKIRSRLQHSNVLTSSNNLSDGPLYQAKVSAEDAILKLTTSELSQAKLRIEFAEQRVQKVVEVNQNNNSEQVNELLQGVDQQLGSLDTLVQNLMSQGGKETEVAEITSMLEKSSTQNLNMFNKTLEKATDQTKPVLEQTFNKAQLHYHKELESLNKMRQKNK